MSPNTQACSQEPRLIHLESAVANIGAILSDVRDLLTSSTKAEERIAALKEENRDQEKRLRRMEQTIAASRWLERVVWILMTAGLGWLFHKGQ